LKEGAGDARTVERLDETCVQIEWNMKRIFKMLKGGSLKIEEDVDIAEAVENQLRFFTYELSRKTVYLNLKHAVTSAGSSDIDDIIYNLLDNAIRYSTGKINIKTSVIKKTAYVLIRNDVAGGAAKGSGLGLEITQNLIKRCKGRLVMREKEGFYTVFARFPVAHRQPRHKTGDMGNIIGG
ncbi:MAG: HAMP domain-containing histidine kinase, partial [Nitrospirae bacterium]|nr:HAMP domain-containing histidine kinase [Nitrospirota bacterium]